MRSIDRTLKILDMLDHQEAQVRGETCSEMANGSAWATVAIDSIQSGGSVPEMLASAVVDLVQLGLDEGSAIRIVEMVSKVAALGERVRDLDESREATLAQSWISGTPSA